MDIGVMGINAFAKTFCKHWIRSGHKIVFADLPGQSDIFKKVSTLGSEVSVTTPDQLASLAEIIVLAVEHHDLEKAIGLMGHVSKKIVVDLVTDPGASAQPNSFFEIQRLLPEVKVVKLTDVYPDHLHQSTDDKQVIYSYSNDQLAQRMVRWSIEGSGYHMIDVDNRNHKAAKTKVN
ncbi:MAG: NAD(P)-binding domain-containing protein [Cyclobacteriaceae bacterium]